MSQRFAITINDDGTVEWHGVDAGKTTVLAMNEEKRLIVLHTAGSYWSDNGGRHYGEARVAVHEFEYAKRSNPFNEPNPRELFLTELFGVMDWKPRGNNWRPKQ